MTAQLDLEDYTRWQAGAATEEMIDLMREVVAIRGLKNVAAALGVGAPVLAHALAGDGRHPLRFEWYEWFVTHAPRNDLAAVPARLRNCDLTPREVLTPEEELDRYKRAILEEVGPTARKAIEAKVHGAAR